MQKVFKKEELSILLRLTLFSSVLIILRCIQAKNSVNLFLFWNMALAWSPLFFLWLSTIPKQKYIRAFLLIGWFLFLPNTLYLITDLKHINHKLLLGLYWTDILMFFSVAILGILLAVISLEFTRKKIEFIWGNRTAHLVTFAAIVLSGVGVYLGRFPRLNSWHVFTEPVETTKVIGTELIEIVRSKDALIFVLLFTVTFWFFYITYRKIRK